MDLGKRFYLARTKYNKNGEETPRKVYGKTEVTASSIELYETNKRIPNMKNAQKLAEHYGVNVLWLLGESESWSMDENSQTVTNITGLSTEAIDSIQKIGEYYPDYIDILNLILANKNTVKVLELLSIAIQKLNDATTNGQEWDDIGSITMNVETMQLLMDSKETAKYLMQLSVDTTKSMYENILRSVWESKKKEEK